MKIKKVILGLLNLLGFYPNELLTNIRGLPRYLWNLLCFDSSKDFPITMLVPCLSDRYKKSGSASGAYFHQDLIVAQRIFRKNPVKHIDVGSRVDGFVAHVASFRSIEVFDIRPQKAVHGIRFLQRDIMVFDSSFHNYCDSISCLHALEHFGLGRYGDEVDPEGHVKGLTNIVAMLKPGGTLYLSVPIGMTQRIEFDCHRVFNKQTLFRLFKQFNLEIGMRHYVDEHGDITASFPDCHLGCGIFELIKR